MKKLYSLMAALMLAVGFINAQCTINPSAQTTPGATPSAATLPCVVRSVAYDEVIQAKIDTAYDTAITIIVSVQAHFHIDSMRLDSVTGLPTGITWVQNPLVLAGGGNGCVKLSGTTTDAVGRYNITGWGTVWTHAHASAFGQNIDTPYVYHGQLNSLASWGNYYLDVINTGGACHVSGINDFSPALNAAFSVYPNPSTGVFEVKLNAGSRVNGEVVVVDLTGRKVFAQPLDVVGMYSSSIDLSGFAKGIYTVQLRTSEGLASKNISID
jgi:hypothetical protein